MRITIDGKRADLSIQQTTLELSWCSRTAHKLRFLGAKEINDVLENIHSRIVLCNKQLSKNSIVVSAHAVKLKFMKK